MKRNVEITVNGAVFTAYVTLEGKPVAMHFDGETTFRRSLTDFPVIGPLDLKLLVKGVNGISFDFHVEVDGKKVVDIDGEIEGGFFERIWAIDLPENPADTAQMA